MKTRGFWFLNSGFRNRRASMSDDFQGFSLAEEITPRDGCFLLTPTQELLLFARHRTGETDQVNSDQTISDIFVSTVDIPCEHSRGEAMDDSTQRHVEVKRFRLLCVCV